MLVPFLCSPLKPPDIAYTQRESSSGKGKHTVCHKMQALGSIYKVILLWIIITQSTKLRKSILRTCWASSLRSSFRLKWMSSVHRLTWLRCLNCFWYSIKVYLVTNKRHYLRIWNYASALEQEVSSFAF